MRKLGRVLAGAAAIVGLAIVPVAAAKKAASSSQRAAVGRVVEGAKFPPGCGVVYISTVDRKWSSFEWIGEVKKAPESCQRYAANGIVLLHFAGGRWHAVSAGSHFDCPIAGREVYKGQPNVPNKVADDLVPYLHCK